MKRLLFFTVLLFLHATVAHSAILPIVEVVSPQGIKAWLIEDHNLPLVSMKFSFRGGVETDGVLKQGTATLATSLLTQGAGKYDENTFQDKLAANSVNLGFSAGRDYVRGSLKMLKRKEDVAFDLLRLALTQPRFDEPVFRRVQQQQITSVRFQLSSPSWQGRYALYQKIYDGHPYGYRSLGSAATVKAIMRSDVQEFAKKYLTRDNLQIAVVGAISAKELGKRLDQVFGDLPAHGAPDDVPDFVWPKKTTSLLVERKGKQTNILFVAPMLKRKNPDWYAARIANYILGGGGFTSHLMKEVRARKGLTYGISTGLAPMKKVSLIVGSFATDNGKTQQAMTLVQKVWDSFHKKSVTEAEIKAAQDYLVGTMALSLTSTDSLAAVMLSMLNQELGVHYLDEREAYLRAVTQDDVTRVIKEWFNPARASFSYVGMPQDINPDYTQKTVME